MVKVKYKDGTIEEFKGNCIDTYDPLGGRSNANNVGLMSIFQKAEYRFVAQVSISEIKKVTITDD